MRKLGKAFHVLSTDPALRQPDPSDAEAVAAFTAQLAAARASGDLSGLPLTGARKPVLWRLRSLTMHGQEELAPAAGNNLRLARMAIQRGLAGMDNAVGSDGEKLDYADESDGRERIVLYDVVAEIHGAYGRGAIIELGARILELSDPSPLLGQG